MAETPPTAGGNGNDFTQSRCVPRPIGDNCAVYGGVRARMKANPAPLTKWLDGATPIDGKPGLDAD